MAYTLRLDRSRDAGQYFPPISHPSVEGAVAHFEQDGFPFDHEGRLAEAFLTIEQKKKLDGMASAKPVGKKPAKTDAKTEAKTEAAPDGEGDAPKPPKPPATYRDKRAVEEAAANEKKPGSDQLNLEMWLRGEVKYPEYRIKQAVRARYNRAFDNIKDVVEFLVTTENLVAIEHIKPEYQKMLVTAEVE